MCLVWRKLAQLFWRRKKYLDFVNVFSLFWCLLLENSATLHLNKIESPSPKDAFYQVWLKLAQWNFVYVFLLFRYYHLSFWAWPFVFTNLNPLFVPSLVEIGPLVLETKIKMWKVKDNINHDNNDDRHRINLTWAFG